MATSKSKLKNKATNPRFPNANRYLYQYSKKDFVSCFVNNANKNTPNDVIRIIFMYCETKGTWIYTIGRNDHGQIASIRTDVKQLKERKNQNKHIQNIYQGAYHTIYSNGGHKNIWVSGCHSGKNLQFGILNLTKIKYFKHKNIKIKNIFTNINAEHTFWMDINDNIYANGCNSTHQFGLKDNNKNHFEPTAIKYLKNVRDIQLSASHTLVLDNDGHVFASGYNKYGAHGLGTNKTIEEFTMIRSLKHHKILKIKTGRYHSLFLSENGNIFGCGDNKYGQLGLGSINNVSTPTLIQYFQKKLIKLINMDCGGYHNLVLDQNGKIYSFGWNYDNNILTPTVINAFKDKCIKRIGCGYMHSYAMSSCHKHYLWGDNDYNECLTNDNSSNVLNPHYINDIVSKETNKIIKHVSLGYQNTIIIVHHWM